MPSEMMDPKGFPSSSFFSDETHLPNEIQVGFWKTGSTPNHYGTKMDTGLQTAGRNLVHSSPQSLMSLDSQLVKPVELPDSYLIRDHIANLSVEKHAIGAERAASYSLRRPTDHHDLGTRSSLTGDRNSYNMRGDKIRATGAQCENGLFSSSLSEMFSRKLRLATHNAPYGHSAGAAASHYEEEPFESLEEMEAQTIGNLLPNDDDLLSGVTDYVGQPSVGEGIEELDLFSSVGGMELGEDGFISGQRDLGLSGGNHNSQLREVAAEHPYGEIPSRTLFVRNINSNVEEFDVRALFEQYGDISSLYTACKHRGFVMVSYYDIRAARNAKTALQNKPLRRRNLDIHFSIPKDNPSDKDIKQGTLVVFNPDSVSNEELRQTFGVYGEIKEIHESPYRSQKRYIEFYDIRAAEAALRALNLSDTGRKIIMLEPNRPGGVKRAIAVYHPEKEPDEFGPYPRQSSSPSNITTTYPGPFSNGVVTSSSRISSVRAPGSPFLENMFHHGISSSVPKAVPSSLARVESLGSTSVFPDACHSPGQLKIEYHGAPNFHPHSLPEYCDGLTNSAASNSLGMAPNIGQFSRGSLNGHTLELNDAVFCGSGNNTRASPGQHYMWNNSPHPQPQGLMWPNSPTFFNGVRSPHPSQGLHAAHVLNGGLPINNNHHVGSAPSPNHSLWDRRQTFGGETPESSGFHPASLGSMRISGNSPHHMDFTSRTMFPPHISGSCMDLSIPSKKVALLSPHQKCMMFPGRGGQMIHSTSPYDSPTERGRARRNEGSSNQGDNKKLFELDIDRILRGEDTRTTLMIKNIPNKYTSKMLLNAIDENHRGTYNFIYLPIDFKNKCNVGYAFINMTEPSLIVPFYQAFNGKKWEKFNSEKVATLAYARIQGKDALVAHFQNSSLMNEDKRCRPILFNTDGPNAGDQVPFPMGAHIRSRPNKTRTVTSEENNQESSSTLSNGEENGDSSSGSGKDSD